MSLKAIYNHCPCVSAAWKIIKTWLPAAGVKKIKFLNKDTLTQYVSDDQKIPAWGGSVEWKYVFEEEVVDEHIDIIEKEEAVSVERADSFMSTASPPSVSFNQNSLANGAAANAIPSTSKV